MGIQSEIMNDRMEETRSQLAEKLETLEDHVSEKVQSATLAVSETVEAVKETVENVTEAVTETVQSVGATFDLPLQADRHPWVVFGGAVALGCLAAQLLGGRSKQSQQKGQADESPSSAFSSAAEEKKNWLGDQLNGLKGLAVNAVMKVVRDLAKESLPEALGQRIGEEVDHLTRKLGGG